MGRQVVQGGAFGLGLSIGSFWALYRVTHLVANLGWVDLDLGCSNILLGQ